MNEISNENMNPDQRPIIRLYAAFVASVALSFVPHLLFAFLSLILFTGVTIAAYVMRSRADANSLKENHATYVIRTIWIAALFLVLTMIPACAYLLLNLDHTPMEGCYDDLLNAAASTTDTMALYATIEPCVEHFIETNMPQLILSLLICGGPVMLYLLHRLAHGLSRAAKGHRIGDPKSWI